MKKVTVALCISMIAIFVFTSVAFGLIPGTGWQTSYNMMSLGASTAHLTMDAYDKNSSTVYSSTGLSMDQYEHLIYAPDVAATYPAGPYVDFSSSLPSGFEGSVVLSSDQPLASAATLTNKSVGTAFSRYQAISSPATTILFPVVKHNWSSQTTNFYIQAAGATSSNVTITYTMNDASTHTQNTTIDAGKMFIFDPANATPAVASSGCGTDLNTSPCFGAATVVSSTDPIAGVVVEFNHTQSPAGFVLSTRGLTDADKSYTIFIPSTKNYYYGGTGGATIMNTGTADAKADITLTVTFVEPGSPAAIAGVTPGTVYTDSEIIGPSQSKNFGPYDLNLGGMPQGCFAAASITSVDDATYDPQLLVGTSNEARNMTITGGKARAVYYGYATSAATDDLACPVHTELVSNWTGGETIVNVGDANTTVHVEYVTWDGTVYHIWTVAELTPGAAIGTNRISNNTGSKWTNDGSFTFASLAGMTFSVHVYSSNGEQLIGLASEAPTTTDKDMMNFECISF